MKQHAGVIAVDHSGLPLLTAERLGLLAPTAAAGAGAMQHSLDELLDQLLLALDDLRSELQDGAAAPALLRLSGLSALAALLAALLPALLQAPLAGLPRLLGML